MDARNGLLRILGVHFVLRLAILFRNGEDAQRLQRFERGGRSWVEHAGANVEVITAIGKSQSERHTNKDSFCENK